MEYDENQNNDDMKWACFTFKKYFKNCPFLRDDLIQNAVLTLLQNKNKFDEKRGEYSTFAIQVCKNSMANYLRQNSHATNKGENLSLDYEYENITFADILPYEDNIEEKLHFENLLQLCRDEVLNNKSEIFRKINLLYLDFVEPPEIVKRLNITRQCVNNYIHKFQNLMREKYCEIVV